MRKLDIEAWRKGVTMQSLIKLWHSEKLNDLS